MQKFLEQGNEGDPVMGEFCQMVMDILRELKDGQAKIEAQMERRQSQVDSIERKLDEHSSASRLNHEILLNAFPSADIEGHRRYHQAIIERIELRNRMINEALIQCAKVGGVSAIGWLLYALWIAFKHEVTK